MGGEWRFVVIKVNSAKFRNLQLGKKKEGSNEGAQLGAQIVESVCTYVWS